MPKMTGRELITELKRSAKTKAIPVVVVSGRESGFDGHESRADYCINKDIDIQSQLETALKEMRQRAKSQASSSRNSAPL